MNTKTYVSTFLCACVFAVSLSASGGDARQVTHSLKHHGLDNNDNFSPDGRFIVYDTRGTVGSGIGCGQSIEIVEVATGREIVLYKPVASVIGERPAPGVAAASFSGVSNDIAFIHGPPLDEVDVRGPYGKPNRNGGHVVADPKVKAVNGAYPMTWLDLRDIATDRDTLPGAHRGGTHRHEYTMDGKRIGFTYNDFLMPQYGRTIGYMEPHPNAPAPASHYFTLLVPMVPTGTAKPGELEVASGDSWIGREGLMRGFIGKVKEDDGSYQNSLFVIDLPRSVDITSADSGSATRFPTAPKGVSIRRLTHDWASGTVRGTLQGDRIAYYGRAADGTVQIFILPSDGSDLDPDLAKRPVQATHAADGAAQSLRWHPSGNSVFYITNNRIASTCVQPGPKFGETVFLTEQGGAERENVVLSLDGRQLAFNQSVAALNAQRKPAKDYAGGDFAHIFVMDVPDSDGDGIMDGQ
jgi:hypothetical protein